MKDWFATDRSKVLALAVLAPFLAELVSGSTPPLYWIFPPTFLTFVAIYGVAAVVIREIATRIHGGFATVLVLGLAFGIVNEGMAAHSLFDPNWPGVGVLASYGRWGGVSWLWAEWIVPFHAVWSIAFPIFLFGKIWPETVDRPLLSQRLLLVLSPVPIGTASLVSLWISPYPLTIVQWAALYLAVAILGVVALWFGPKLSTRRWLGSWRPMPPAAFLVGVAFFVVGQIGTWQLPDLGPWPLVGGGLLLAIFLAFGAVAGQLDASADAEQSRFGLVLGGVAFYVALTPITEFALGRVGVLPIDAIVMILLLRLYYRRTRGRD